MLILFSLYSSVGIAESTDFQKECSLIINEVGKLSEAERLNKLFNLTWQHRMEDNPEFATSIGYSGYDDKWTDLSLEAFERRKEESHLQLEALNSISRSKLSEVDRLNYDLFQDRLMTDVDGSKFPAELMPITQLGGLQQDAPQLLSIAPTKTVNDYHNLIARLKGIPGLIYHTRALLEKGLKEGVTPPRITLRDVPQQVKNQIVTDPSKAPILMAFTNFPAAIPLNSREELKQQAYAVYVQEIAPALESFQTYLVQTYIPACRKSIACSELPQGKEWYSHLIKRYTTTDLTPEEVFSLGQSEVKRLRGEMEEIIKHTGFQGDFAAFCEFLRTDSQFFYSSSDDLLGSYRDICKRIDPELIRLFGYLPRLPYGVKPVPAYAEKSQTTAYYEPGSLAAGRPGYFFANTYDLNSRPKWEMEALTLHEAVPGHHLQTAIAQELNSLPEFRQWGWYTAYGEGWALYAEGLGEEMGLYQDPYSKFGQLTYETWRAIRLVVDVGMHWMGWTREQAIDYFKSNSCKAEHDITVEIDRYIVWPGQALAYKIGQLKIKMLRAEALQELGEKFDLRAFHDLILRSGPLPLEILEKRVKSWVADQKKN